MTATETLICGSPYEVYAGLVYSAALRQVHDPTLAQDVAQAAFTVLARQTRPIPPQFLAGWLLKTTRYCAQNARRIESRRHRHETAAALGRPAVIEPTDHAAIEIMQFLDEAMARLPARESTAIALRYLENKPMAEVAGALGTSVDAAAKIVSRSLVKLRGLLASKGVVVPTVAAMVVALQRVPSHAAPVSFTASASSAQSALIAKGTLHTLIVAKVAALAAAAAVLAAGAGVVMMSQVSGSAAPTSAPSPAPVQLVAPSEPADYLNNAESPFLQLTGCRIDQTLNLTLSSQTQPTVNLDWCAEEYPQVSWTTDAALAGKVSGYTLTVTPRSNPSAKEVFQVDNATDTQPLLDTARSPGEYDIQLTANGDDSKPLASASGNVTVHELPQTHIFALDLQPDGTVRFTIVIQAINSSRQALSSTGIHDEGYLQVEKMADEVGNPIRFTLQKQANGIQYQCDFKTPAPPGAPMFFAMMGRTMHAAADLGNGMYSFSWTGGADGQARQVELVVLPPGAVLAGSDPKPPNQVVNGRVQVYMDTPMNVHNSISIQYRMPAQ